MAAILASLEGWNWIILGLFLLIGELFISGYFLLWFAIAGFIVGGITLFIQLSWEIESILFVLLSLACLLVGRRVFARKTADDRAAKLNLRAARLVGKEFTLHQALSNGRGQLLVDDGVWQITGPDLEAGAQVVVTHIEGNKLHVRPALPQES